MGRRKQPKNESGYPDYVIETIARCILPTILEALEDEEILKEFEEWKKKQEQEAQHGQR